MSTKVHYRTSLEGSRPAYSPSRTAPPPFLNNTTDELVELASLTSSSTSETSPPAYEEATDADANAPFDLPPISSFVSTLELQIQTPGKALLGFPFPPRPDPIPVFAVGPSPGELGRPVYVSIRPTRGSGSCYLVRGDDAAETPICTTTYRFGPGKPPVVQLLPTARPSASPSSFSASGDDATDGPSFEITCHSAFSVSRAQVMRTHLGTFGWRYATRRERAAVGASSLLIMEKVVAVAQAGSSKSEEHRTPVARFVRSDELRSPGSSRTTAGNGGRLQLDLRAWADAKDEKEEMVLIAVASCICMLKKEVDRRRMHQMIVLGAGASGGP
jgi:hypothetical protein